MNPSPRFDPRLQADLARAFAQVAIPYVCRVDVITEATRTGDLAADLNCLRRQPGLSTARSEGRDVACATTQAA